ncbi:MAG: hypothetical protein AB7F25_12315 [Deferribacterales bacterium]
MMLGDHFKQILDDAAAREIFIGELHGGKCKCPDCGELLGNIQRFKAGKKVNCVRCGKWFNYATGTFLSGVKMSPAVLMSLLIMLDEGVADETISRLLGISLETIRLWRVRRRENV